MSSSCNGGEEVRKASMKKEAEDFIYEIKNLLDMFDEQGEQDTESSYNKIVAETLLFILERLKLFRTLFFAVFGVFFGYFLSRILELF